MGQAFVFFFAEFLLKNFKKITPKHCAVPPPYTGGFNAHTTATIIVPLTIHITLNYS